MAAKGSISDTRGLSVRFPRFVRIRDDKNIEDATRSSMLAELWRRQDGLGKGKEKKGGKGGAGADDGDLVDAEVAESDVEDEYSDEEGD